MRLFQLARVRVLLGHAAAFAFSFGMAALHIFFLLEPFVGNALTHLDSTIESLFVPTIVGAVLGSIGHLLLFLHTLVQSVRLLLRSQRIKPMVGVGVSTGVRPIEAVATRSWWGRLRTCIGRYKQTFLRFWMRYQAEITRLFILWEVALQTFQANKISQLVPTKWINRLVTLVIVTNCWFSPVLHFILGARPKAYVRLNRLLIDSCLDVAYSIGIPLAIFLPYYRQYDGTISLFPSFLYFTDTWYINAVSELRQVFITSWLDLVSKVTGAVALQYRLYTILNAVNVAQREADVRVSQRNIIVKVPIVKSRVTRLLDIVLMACGAMVLALHIQVTVTSSMKHNSGCLLEMRPWGSTQYTCAALEVSCSQWHTRGDREQLNQAISKVDPKSVQILIVSNCPALEMPTAVQSLHSLLMFKMYNSTVVAWAEDAAFTSTHHPTLSNLYFSRVNMSAMPLGLLSNEFPKTVWAIMFCKCNVTDFPARITTVWANAFLVVVEGNPALEEIPYSISQIPALRVFGLNHNHIQSIPDDALANTSMMLFDVAANPLRQLPDSIGSVDLLQQIDVRGTNVSEIPFSWTQRAPTQPSPPAILHGGNSALCDGRAAPSLSWLVLDCLPVPGTLIKYAYPIDDEDKWRRANQ